MRSSFLAALALLGLSHAWTLDVSCTRTKGVAEIVRDGMAGAFAMTDAGIKAIDTEDTVQDKPSRLALGHLYSYLFGSDLTRENGDRISANLKGVKVFNTERPLDLGIADEVVVFCDYSRFDEKQRPSDTEGSPYKWAWDTVMKVWVEQDEVYKGCKKSLSFSTVAGYTNNYAMEKPASIQICRWYLNYIRNAQYKSWRGLRPKWVIGLALDNIIPKIRKSKTAMDNAALFDHILLHELTHAVKGEPTDDVTGGSDSYGWKNCVTKLSTNQGGGFMNADSLAFFCLGAEMILEPNEGERLFPQADGSTAKPNQQKRWLNSSWTARSPQSRHD